MNFQKVEPIHLAQLKQGRLYRRSQHIRHHSGEKEKTVGLTTPYVEQLAVKTSRSQKVRERQGGGTFSYRRWYDSSINFSSIVTPRAMLAAVSHVRPDTEYYGRDRRLSGVDIRRQMDTPSPKFRRNLKCLRNKVQEKIRQKIPEALHKLELMAPEGRGELKGLFCKRIQTCHTKPNTEKSSSRPKPSYKI